MVEFKDVYITAKDGKIQWPILDIERITFDETSLTGVQFKEAVQMWMNRAPTKGPVWDNLDAALAEKGAEIARLKEEITRVNNTWYAYHSNLKDQLAELEKLTALQKETIDAQGKQLREARETVLNDVWIKCFNEMNSQSANRILFHYDPEDYIPSLECGEILVILESLGLEDPAQKAPDPELFICDHAKGCMSEFCSHRRPHERWDGCNNVGCDSRPGIPAKCIPYKEPTAPQPSAVPTSGTGTAPEDGRTLKQEVKDLEIVMDDTLLCTYPGMAKDIGDLTLRVDKMEKDAEILKMQDQIKGLEHRLGLAQDRIAEIHPSGCVPHVKSKPKSRLKTDRVKKVK